MIPNRIVRCIIIVSCFFIPFRSDLLAQEDSPYSRPTLKGLEGVEVMVQEIQDEEVMRHNLNNVQIQTDVELKLRTAGIKVFAIDSKPLDEKRNPVLYVYINFLKVSEGMYAFNAYVKLAQRISLVRNPHTIAYATTWETGGIGAIGISKVSQIRGEIKDFVDEFINAYSAVQTR